MHPLRAPDPSEESVGSLVARLGNDVARIVRAELGLLQARVGAALVAVRVAGALIVIGAMLALGGLGALVAGLVLVVSQWLLPWEAAFAVGGGLLVLGVVLLALQSRVVSGGVREALADVHVEVRGEEPYRGQ